MAEPKKIEEFVWEIQKENDMKVPARVYTDEKYMKILQDEEKTDWSTLKQLRNVACLPGIQKYAIALADCHPGYGSPIGGVCAMDLNEGIITFGSIGFDINCLTEDAKVLHRFGYNKKIVDFEKQWFDEKIKCVNPSHEVRDTNINNFIITKSEKIIRLKTETDQIIEATEDHPFLTPNGMKPLRNLEKEELVSIFPFEGVVFEEPSDQTIISEKEIEKLKLSKTSQLQIIKKLKEIGLLPLKLNHPKLPILIKLLGYALGDGSFYFKRGKRSGISFYGNEEDLKQIKANIKELGVGCSNIYKRERNHKIKTLYDTITFRREEASIICGSQSFCIIMLLLGLPYGDKTLKKFHIKKWLISAKKWQKRLFLAGLFGAELSTPKTVTKHGFNFGMPVLSMNKKLDRVSNGRYFLNQIKVMLEEFGVKSKLIKERIEYKNPKGKISIRLRLTISEKPDNLIRLWSHIGFEYNKKRTFMANAAVAYLKLKNKILDKRKDADLAIKKLKTEGTNAKDIKKLFISKYINERFIERSLWNGRKTDIRIAYCFPTFEKYLPNAIKGLGNTGQIWDKITEKEEIKQPTVVYDFTVDDFNHNFIANGFVVSNCGVRTLKTSLTKKDVLKKQEELAQLLYNKVPAGLGSRGQLALGIDEIDEVLEKGSEYAVKRGFGLKEDLEFTELNGRAEGADPKAVSRKAKERQYKEVGTLGSGNHYLEVQYVSKIFDEKIANAFGLEEDQILISIHCGSRGLGHQIGTDYLSELEDATRKYNIQIKDKELVGAPIQSEEGKKYFSAVNAGTNCAFANRQVIAHLTRQCFSKTFGIDEKEIKQLYDVGHNTAKIEEHEIDGKMKKVLVHRKGSTRGFGPNCEGIPKTYKSSGQPIIVGGTMGTASYILAGTEKGMKETFGSTVHGAGRVMSRNQAIKNFRGETLVSELSKKGIIIKGHSLKGLAEEAPEAYKNIYSVIDVTHNAGIAKKVVEMKPLICVKG